MYAALSPARPGAALFERAVSDLWGHQAADAMDTRPWLDHGTWPMLRPLSDRPVPNAGGPEVPELHEGVGQVVGLGPLPPVPLTGPGHWRMRVDGGRVLGLEARLGYGHRGVPGLMRGKPAAAAARFAARLDGAATVAHSVAFARAVEAAVDVTVPPRVHELRHLMLRLERAAVALHDLDAVAAALGRPLPAVQRARAGLLEACGAAFGHRLMMDCVWPGGATDLAPGGGEALAAAIRAVPKTDLAWPQNVGVLPIAAALRLGVAAVPGRASGRQDPCDPAAEVTSGGDLAARMRLRATGLSSDLALAWAGLLALPGGETMTAMPHGPGEGPGEGLGGAPGPQGPVWHWVRLAGGVVAACFAADPAWLALPAFEASAPGPVDALPAVAASFGLHLAGMEL